jgi:hypothetical protein
MQHIRNATLRDINVTGAPAPFLATNDVTGSGLENAAKYEPPPPAPARRGGFGRQNAPGAN